MRMMGVGDDYRDSIVYLDGVYSLQLPGGRASIEMPKRPWATRRKDYDE